MAYYQLPTKSPLETQTVSFLFGSEPLGVGETVNTSGIVVTCTVFSCLQSAVLDTNPTAVLSGVPNTSSLPALLQLVTGGLDGNTYELRATVTTSAGRVLVRQGLMPVGTN